MSDDAPEPLEEGSRPSSISFESRRPGPLSRAVAFVVGFAWNAGLAWAASRLGASIAQEAGMPSHSLKIEACPLLIAGLIGGILLQRHPSRVDRVLPFVALAAGAAAGLGIATNDVSETALRWMLFLVPAMWAAFANWVVRR